MYLMIERGMPGGVCMISKRRSKADNTQVGNIDPKQPLSNIVDWDANNVYGWAMSQFLPMSQF